MQQTINLFDHLTKRETIAVSSQHIVIAAMVTLVAVLLVSLVSVYNARQDITLVQQAERDNERLQAQLSELRAESSNDSKSHAAHEAFIKTTASNFTFTV